MRSISPAKGGSVNVDWMHLNPFVLCDSDHILSPPSQLRILLIAASASVDLGN
jgi:hypothetical protein